MVLFELFYVFFYIGLLTFGGGYAMIPMITEEVTKRGWIMGDQIADFIAISESTPGPFAVNIATFVGNSVGGIGGSILATLGVILPSFIIILIIAIFLRKFSKANIVNKTLKNIRPVIVGMVSATAIIFLIKLIFFGNHEIYSVDAYFDRTQFVLLLIITFFCVLYKRKHKKSLNPIFLLAICAVVGIVFFGLFQF